MTMEQPLPEPLHANAEDDVNEDVVVQEEDLDEEVISSYITMVQTLK